MTEEIYRKYARLVLGAGINLQEGQKVLVHFEACHWDFGRVLVEEAYRMGAGYVEVEEGDPGELASRVRFGRDEDLDYVPSWVAERNRVMVEEGWARLFFFGPSEPDLMGELDKERLGRVQKAGREMGKILANACGAGEISWSGAALPTRKWAMKVFPDETPERAEEMLWDEVVRILGLDEAEPVLFWRKVGKRTVERSEKLEGMGLEFLRFRGAGTDLRVRLLPDSRWVGGGLDTVDGVMTIPNLPTFETFTTPDLRGTEGRARVTCPVEILGSTVEGAWFVFEEGKVVDYGADVGVEALERMFAICPQSAYLGEVALVDGSSPIFESGLTYHSILFDENATSHIALGNGYVSAAAGAEGKLGDDLLEMGVNVSLLHHDVMIGGDGVEVDGILADGEEVALIRDGMFVF